MESKLKAAAQDSVGELPNLLLREGGYPHLPTTPIKQEPELTDWISGDLKPVRDGLYERNFEDLEAHKCFYYSWFINGTWSCGGSGFDVMSINPVQSKSIYQNRPWRGLAKNPEVQE